MFLTNPIQSLALSTIAVSSINDENYYELAAPAPLPTPEDINVKPYFFDNIKTETVQITSRQKVLTFEKENLIISEIEPENIQKKEPAIIQSYEKQPYLIDNYFKSFTDIKESEILIERLSLLNLSQSENPKNFGICEELETEEIPSNINNELELSRAAYELTAILFCSEFHSDFELNALRFEIDNSDLDKAARFFTFKKFLKHYLYEYVTESTDPTEEVLELISLSEYSEAAAILEKYEQNRLALVVISAKVNNWREIFTELEENQTVNAELVLRALSGDMTAYRGYLTSFLEVLAACSEKSSDLSETIIEYNKNIGELKTEHFFAGITQLYAGHFHGNQFLEAVEECLLNGKIPPMAALVIGNFLLEKSENSSAFTTELEFEQSLQKIRKIRDKLCFRAALEKYGQGMDDEALELLEIMKLETGEMCSWCKAKIEGIARESDEVIDEQVIDILDYVE